MGLIRRGGERVCHAEQRTSAEVSIGEQERKRQIWSFTQQIFSESQLPGHARWYREHSGDQDSPGLALRGSQSSGEDRPGIGNDTSNSLSTTLLHSVQEECWRAEDREAF